MAVDAVVLAGDRAAARLLYGTNKAFLRLRGKPLLSYVVSALDRSDQVRSIHIVGPCDKLRELLSEFKYNKPVAYIEQGENVFQNIWYGSLHTFPEYERGSDYQALQNSPEADKSVLLCTCDIPLIEPAEIDHYIKNAPMADYDFCIGITRKELLLPFAPRGDEPGISFAYFVTREIVFRQANITMLRPLRLGYVMNELAPRVYQLRYQKQWKNIVKAFLALIGVGAGVKALYYYVVLQLGMSLDLRNRKRLRDLIRRGVAIPGVLACARPIFQTRVGVFETLGPGPTIDTDNEIDLVAADKMFERWKEIQLQMLKGKYPLPQDI
jgi:GTP:adenosylcobinamide-phosphate guanylyltransferase